MVGTSLSGSGQSAFIWTPEHGLQNIGDVTGGNNEVTGSAINNSDQITGTLFHGATISPYLWDPVTGMQDIGDLPTGEHVGYGFGIGNSGLIVGRGNTSQGDRAFVWSAAIGIQDLGTLPDGFGSYAYSLNDAGKIVGHSTVGGAHHAFLWDAGAGMTDLNSLMGDAASGWVLLEAFDINNNGWIVGRAANPDGEIQGFLLMPVPEPHVFWMFGSGLLLVSGVVRWRRGTA